MTNWTPGLAALAIFSASGAWAGGIDRAGQDVGLLFESGRVLRLELGSIRPNLQGDDLLSAHIGDVAGDYVQTSLGYKADLNDKLGFGVILDQPFGADVVYPGTTALLGGTTAQAKATALTGLLRYRVSDRFSLVGGLRAQRASAMVGLSGLAYGPPAGVPNGYSVELADQTRFGYVLGAAFEIPDIALRAVLSYNSAIDYDFDTVEKSDGVPIGVNSTKVSTPQSVNLDLQTGIAADTLLFGSVRWVDWSEFRLKPTLLNSDLIDLEDTTTYTLGVGRKFNDSWSGLISLNYEKEGRPLVSPLAPSTGQFGATIGAVYTRDRMKVTMGVNYTRLGDATPATAGAARASFTGNEAVGIGLRIDYAF